MKGIKKKLELLKLTKEVKSRSFNVGDMVWKTILPLETKSNKFGKWSPSLKGPYKVIKIIFRNSNTVQMLKAEYLFQALNGRYLNKYYPSMWQEGRINKDDYHVLALPLDQFLS